MDGSLLVESLVAFAAVGTLLAAALAGLHCSKGNASAADRNGKISWQSMPIRKRTRSAKRIKSEGNPKQGTATA